ncbi:uncharacterized protein LOC110906540 [Helianthus annuus]|uniref:uncharacterized protein LOC110906540 n=1 Tax=Helianthus annuus TaxID=4232 RepID=UPI000B909369|nr:uncharacterized protein LOC110906540 [Helianthus annuus]
MSAFKIPPFNIFNNSNSFNKPNLKFHALTTNDTSPITPQSFNVDESPSPHLKTAKKKSKTVNTSPVKRLKWTTEIQLAKGLIHISQDLIVGNNQKSTAFWKQVEECFMQGENVNVRDEHNLRIHWHMIKSKVNTFNELYIRISSNWKSGISDDQIMTLARAEYIPDKENKQPFPYEHVWNIMKCPKWVPPVKI